MRLVFFGSPDFALPILERLGAAGHRIVLVVSQPARPVGRRGAPRDPAVARRAKELGLPVLQPASLKDEAVVEVLSGARADAFVVVAYGKILPRPVLDLPRLACLNVHASLLPRWRGASPVQAALLAGDRETGVSIMRMEAGMDTGPVYAALKTEIAPDEDAETLGRRLAELGAGLLVTTLRSLEEEGGPPLTPSPQDASLATYCPKIAREDGRIDWLWSAVDLVRRDRAFTPWPGLFTFRGGTRVKLSGLTLVERAGDPGAVLETEGKIVIACGEKAVAVARLQAEGRRALPAREFVQGERVAPGEVWGG